MGFFDWFRKKDPKEAFGERLLREIRKAGEKRPARFDKEGFKIVVGKDHTFYLNNAFDEYMAADPDQRQQILERYSRLREEPDIAKTLEEARAHLVPRVRERFYYESLRLAVEMEGHKLPGFAFKPLADHFVVELAYDLPEQTMQVHQGQLDEWGTTLEDGLLLSLDLLRANTPAPMKPVRPGLYASSWGDSYAPSRILLPEFIAAYPVEGEPVVAIPNRDLLLLAGSHDAEALEEMARRVHQAIRQPRFMTGQTLIFSEGSWSLFLPDPEHPAHLDLHTLHQHSMAGFYEEQKTLMNSLHEKTGIDVFVASLELVRNKESNRVRSYCVWSDGIDTMLPESDDVMFVRMDAAGNVDKENPPVSVPWTAVRDRFSLLMSPIECYPPRWRVRECPVPAELQEFRKPT